MPYWDDETIILSIFTWIFFLYVLAIILSPFYYKNEFIEKYGKEEYDKMHTRYTVESDGYTLSCNYLPKGYEGERVSSCYIVEFPE